MKRHKYKFLVVVCLGILMAVFNNCGSPFGQPSPLYFNSSIFSGGSAASYDAFSKTVYPLTRANCASCHAVQQPQHASADVKTAHDAVLANYKVNFTNIPSSRMVKKLREDRHNCWGDCESNAMEMEDAIAAWYEAIKDSGSDVGGDPVDTKVYTAESKTLAEEYAVASNVTRLNVIMPFIESGMLKPPMVKAADALGSYLHVPNVLNNTLIATDPGAGTVNFNFQTRAAGTYRVWALVDAPNTSDNGFFVNITTTNVGVREWEIPVTMGSEWRMLPNVTWTLANNSTHNIEIRQRKDGTKIRRLVITSDNTFNGTNANDYTAITLTFDLTEQLKVPGITFKVDLLDYDMYSYKFQNPRIITTQVPVKVKNAQVLVNGTYNPQHSTFTLIDKVATAQDPILLTYAMLVIKDKGMMDKFSFRFETLKLDSGAPNPVDVASLESFRTKVWPISRTNCINCHTVQNPAHAHDDYTQAHDIVVTQSVVNFTTPANSKLVTKVRGGHNCGNSTNCTNIANAFQAAIIEWKNDRDAAGGGAVGGANQ